MSKSFGTNADANFGRYIIASKIPIFLVTVLVFKQGTNMLASSVAATTSIGL